ncbi:hypothetical protein BKA60DRAFT_611625 [Fusarium oxysporum]|nr:hypothetical protein BKA60DRAFT_611625 [Fusarium oxysporum]
MFPQSLSQAAIMATLCFAGLASAVRESGDPSPAIISVSTSTTTLRADETQTGNPDDKVMVPCAGHITQCGVEDKAKIIYVPKSTRTITNKIVTTSVVVLPTSTRVIESVTVSTVTNTTKGHCRETHYLPGEPVEVTVDVLIVTTEEIQPISNTTTWITSVVTASAIEQCFLERYTILGRGPGSQGSPGASAAAEAASARSSDSVSPAASTPAASDESHSDDDSAQQRLGTVDDQPEVIGTWGSRLFDKESELDFKPFVSDVKVPPKVFMRMIAFVDALNSQLGASLKAWIMSILVVCNDALCACSFNTNGPHISLYLLFPCRTRPNQNRQPICGSLPENPYGDYKIQATLGKYVASAANGGHLSASGTSANDADTFSSAYVPNAGTLQLARGNQYVKADQSGASALSATRSTASTWERFIIRQKIGESQGVYSIRAASNGKYVRVGDDGALVNDGAVENDATGFRFVKA